MNKCYEVYIHINKINGKVYIGQSNNTQRRWRNEGIEYYNYNKSMQDQTPFWKALNKYGWDNFEHKILKSHLSLEEANYWEDYYITYYQSRDREKGYNVREGGSNGELSESTKQKLSEIAKEKGRWVGDKNPRHIDPLFGERNGMYGKHHTEETKKKISEARKGSHISEETKQKISKFMNEHHPRAKKVRCIETGEIFLSSRKAAEAYHTAHSCIARVCNGERQTTKGKHWEWVEEDGINSETK